VKRNLAVALCLTGIFAAGAYAQETKPQGEAAKPQQGTGVQIPGNITTIPITVNLVNVLFTVTDKKKRLVLDMTKDDFEVFEDQKPQKILFFSRETDLPLRIGILIDTSNSIRERLRFEQEAAIDFLTSTIRPDKDQAFVLSFDVTPQLIQDFTDDTSKLADAIRNLQAGGGTGLYDAMYYAAKEKMQYTASDPYIRRVMVIVSDGRDNQSEHTRDEALSMVRRGEATVFAISTNRSGFSSSGDKVLKFFASETGGRAFFPFEAEDVDADFRQIAKELRSQYSLAYTPTNGVHDGTFRKITVDTTEKGYEVRAKTGYFAPSPGQDSDVKNK
jgi:Ca-activated chloride channel family protein